MNKLWNTLSYIGVKNSMPIYTSRKVVLTNQLSYISFLLVVLMNLTFMFVDFVVFEPMSIITSPIILTAPLLNRLGYYKFSSFSIATLMPLAAMFFSSLSKTLMPTPLPILSYIFPKILLISFLALPLVLIDQRNKVLLVTAVLINLSCIFFVEELNNLMGVPLLPDQVTFDNYDRIDFMVFFPITILMLGFIFLNRINYKYDEQLFLQTSNLEKAYGRIEEINENLTDSIEYAKYIQNAILPEKKKFSTYFSDSFVFYKAKSIVSGDFYFIKTVEINNDKCTVVAAIDCTGHGVPGGFMSMLGVSMMNDIVQNDGFKNSAEILNKLRNNLKVTLNQTGDNNEQKDGMEMALIAYYPNQNRMEFSGARNSLFIKPKNEDLQIYKGDIMPIGIHVLESPFKTTNIELEGEEMCYLFTDGVIDQMNPSGTKFMSKRLKKLLLEISNQKCYKQKELFKSKINSWMEISPNNYSEQIDDMLLLGFRINNNTIS